MTQSGPVMERTHEWERGRSAIDVGAVSADAWVEVAERDVRETLRGQIARLERESSAIVADAFPHISPADQPDPRSSR